MSRWEIEQAVRDEIRSMEGREARRQQVGKMMSWSIGQWLRNLVIGFLVLGGVAGVLVGIGAGAGAGGAAFVLVGGLYVVVMLPFFAIAYLRKWFPWFFRLLGHDV
jgi:hypothetical protein